VQQITTSTIPVSITPRRGGRAWLSMVWLATFLLALRAFLPTGFMPDPDALRAGRFQIIYCSGAAPMPPGMAMSGHGMAAGAHPMTDGQGTAVDMAMAGGHGMAADMDTVPSHGRGEAPGGSGMVSDCPYGPAGTLTYVPPAPAVRVPMLAVAWHMPAPIARTLPASSRMAGPPLGSRAPPHRLDRRI
jgi:hypothetical protein